MSRKLIIDGNAVYEIDEECMLKQKVDEEKGQKKRRKDDAQDCRRDGEER